MTKIWEWIKKWGLAIIGFVAGLFLLSRKPSWVNDKEREIKDRNKQINVAKKEVDEMATTYEEAKKKHDEAIEQAQTRESSPGFTDPDSAAGFIDDILGRPKS